MVNKYDTNDDDFEVTEDEHHDAETLELEDEEERGSDKLKQLRHKLQKNDEEKRHLMETMQRERADFLNARKRLEGERALDKQKHTKKHVEALLPLCDSFEMAMHDKAAWEKADASWRKGIEGISAQLQRLLQNYGVSAIGEVGEAFDPRTHEAIGTAPVTEKKEHDTVVAVLQTGYKITQDDTTEVIRPARVTTGSYEGN